MDEQNEIKLAEARQMLEALESGNLHVGSPFEGRTEAKIADLRRKIAECQIIKDRSDAARS